jgi:PAS domain S-box-containing protein
MERRPNDLSAMSPSDCPPVTGAGEGACSLSSSQRPPVHDLNAFFDLALDLFCVAGFDGYLKHLNPAWTRNFGWTVEELKSRPFLEFVHPDDRARTEAEMDKLASGVTTTLFVNRGRHRDGGCRWLQWNASPGPGNGCIYATARDVTRKIEMEREIIRIADREKEHLGRDLHDSVCQTIAGIGALSTTLSRRLRAQGDAGSSDSAAEIAGLLNDALAQVRHLSHSLALPVQSESDICDCLEALALQCENLFGVTCTVDCVDPPASLSTEVKLHLLRIAQEAQSNAVIHGHAGRIDIVLRRTAHRCEMTIMDDGSGFGDLINGHAEGIGLHSMKYRAALIGGYLRVARREGRGTAVICTFPHGGDTVGREGRRDGRD